MSTETKNGVRYRIPYPGQRILRSMVAAWVCMAIYYLRGSNGIPFLSVIAALQCIQPYSETMRQMGKKRIIGTLVGALWGALVLYLEYLVVGHAGLEEIIHFALMGACAGAVIYSTVLLHIPDNAYFAAVVFLSIAMNHVTDINPGIYIINRVIDTTIGVLVGCLVNSVHLPRIRDMSTLFISGIDQTLSGEKHTLTPYTKVELNRLIRDGAKFTVMTKETSAMIRELMDGVKLECPVVIMDGAAMYDLKTRQYLETNRMDRELSRNIDLFLGSQGAHYFINTIEDNLLVTFYREMSDGPMKKLYSDRRTSPYRNYVHTNREINEDILYFTVVGTEEEMRALGDSVLQQPFASQIRIDFDSYKCDAGNLLLRIFAKSATRENMLSLLKKRTGTEYVVKYGKEVMGADVRSDYTGDMMVKDIKKCFERIDLRGWRNIVHL